MRPVTLEMVGFGAFRERTEVDFSNIELAAIVGQTGAGKSTIIDAVTFALYGSVPRYDRVNVVAPIVNQLSNEAKVSLTFEVRGQTYVAIRIVRRQKSDDPTKLRASTKEARLELHQGEEVITLAGNVKELDVAIEDLLGLDFSQFTRTIVLPQGEFAKFLRDEPAERQKLIRRLLNLDIFAKMGSTAREKMKELQAQVTAIESELERLNGSASELTEAEIVTALDDLRVYSEKAKESLATINAQDLEQSELADKITSINADLKRLNSVTQASFVPDSIEDSSAGELRLELEKLQEETEQAEKVRQRISLQLIPSDELDEIRQQIATYDKLTAIDTELQATMLAHAKASENISKLSADLADAEAALKAVSAELEHAHKNELPQQLRSQLKTNANCMVCDQVVTELPKPLAVGDHAELKRSYDTQSKTVQACNAELYSQRGRVEQLDSTIDSQQLQLQKLKEVAADFDDYEILVKSLETNTEMHQQLSEADHALSRLRKSQTELATSLRKAEGAEKALLASFVAIRDSVSTLSPPAISDAGVLADWVTFTGWAETKMVGLNNSKEELELESRELKNKLNATVSELLKDAKGVGVQAKSPLEVIQLVQARERALQLQQAEIERQTNEKVRLQGKVDTFKAEASEYKYIGDHLKANGFEGWLLEEVLSDVTMRATKLLLNLSQGQYSLEVMGRNFLIVDHNNADERRDVRTLSGGETFLASLALALALSESIIEHANGSDAALGSMFLDEGFGTLDTETLDTAAAAIEELASSGRMVCIITHVRELAERLPVKFEVTKGINSPTLMRVEN